MKVELDIPEGMPEGARIVEHYIAAAPFERRGRRVPAGATVTVVADQSGARAACVNGTWGPWPTPWPMKSASEALRASTGRKPVQVRTEVNVSLPDGHVIASTKPDDGADDYMCRRQPLHVLGILQVFQKAFRHPGLRLAATAAIAERISPDVTPQAVMLANLGVAVEVLRNQHMATEHRAIHRVNNAVDVVRLVLRSLDQELSPFVPRVPVLTKSTASESEACSVFFEGLRDLVAGLSEPRTPPDMLAGPKAPKDVVDPAELAAAAGHYMAFASKSSARVALIPRAHGGASRGAFRSGVWYWDPEKGDEAGPFDVLLVEDGYDVSWLAQARTRLKEEGYEIGIRSVDRVGRKPDVPRDDLEMTRLRAESERATQPPLRLAILLADGGLGGIRPLFREGAVLIQPDEAIIPILADASMDVLLVEQGADPDRIMQARRSLKPDGYMAVISAPELPTPAS